MLIPKKIKFTPEGYQKIVEDLKALREKRKGAVVSLRTAREMGDLSENGAYKAARFELSSIDREIRRLTYLIRFGQVTAKASTNDQIDFGNTVTLDDGKKHLTFMLVGGYESDPKQNKLSIQSPIGKAIIGKRTNDQVTVITPTGKTTYTILKIN